MRYGQIKLEVSLESFDVFYFFTKTMQYSEKGGVITNSQGLCLFFCKIILFIGGKKIKKNLDLTCHQISIKHYVIQLKLRELSVIVVTNSQPDFFQHFFPAGCSSQLLPSLLELALLFLLFSSSQILS